MVKSFPASLLLTSTPSLPNRVDGLLPEMNDLITSPLLVTNCVLNITYFLLNKTKATTATTTISKKPIPIISVIVLLLI